MLTNPLDQVNAFSGILPANGAATPGLIAQRRKLAEAMLQQGTDASPIASPWQGAARLAQAYVGGTMMNKANQMDIQGRQDAASKLSAAMQPGATAADQAAAFSSPFIDPSTVVGMANSNRQFGLENQRFNQEKTNADRTYQLQASEAGWKPLADGTFVNILTGQKIDPYGTGGGAASQAPVTDPTQAQPIPAPITSPQMPTGGPQAGLGSNPADAAPMPAQAGPMPVAPQQGAGEPNYAGKSQVQILRERGMPITPENLTAATALREAAPGMSGADLAQGEKYRAEVTQNPDYAAYQSGLGSLNSMVAAGSEDNPAANAAFLHAFAETLAPGKVLKSPNGTIQYVPDSPENFSAALKMAQSYLTGEGKLTAAAKQEMLDQAYGQVGTYKQRYDALMASEGSTAKNAGVHLDKVVPGLGDLPARANEPTKEAPAGPVSEFNWTPGKGLHK